MKIEEPYVLLVGGAPQEKGVSHENGAPHENDATHENGVPQERAGQRTQRVQPEQRTQREQSGKSVQSEQSGQNAQSEQSEQRLQNAHNGQDAHTAAVELTASLAANAAFCLATDSGADLTHAAGVSINYLMGDFDSISEQALAAYRASDCEIISVNPHKDETDLELALNFIASHFTLSTLPLVVTNVLGGRIDHELAALGALSAAAHLKPLVIDSAATVVFLNEQNPELKFSDLDVLPDADTLVSVLALGGEAVVSEVGLTWELDHARLRPLDPRGVSNVFNATKNPDAYIRVFEGSVAVFVLGLPVRWASC
ncbi:MAG: thiamine diphosphokinase [Coriobacteriia bacterium]|nr:thiamine diphosphokinase [Coriobacteriia bacterium]